MVGCGGSGSNFHAPVWWNIEDADFVAVCDIIAEKAQKLAKKYHVKAYADLDEMLKNENLDILDVATQPKDHAPCAIKGFEASCHVYSETSLSVSSVEAKRMIDAAEKAGRFLGYNCNYRFSPHHAYLKRLIDAGELGDLCFIDSVGHISNHHHRTDLMRFFGGEVNEVYSKIVPYTGQAPPKELQEKGLSSWQHRCSMTLLKFDNGGVGSLTGTGFISWDVSVGGFMKIDYQGTGGRVITYDIVGWLERYHADRRELTVWKPRWDERKDFGLTWKLAIEAFYAAVSKELEPPVTGMDGLRYHQIAEAMAESSRRNSSVKPY